MGQILLLEEDKREFDQLRRCIESNGHNVWKTTNIPDALTFLNDYKVDLIISAINLENVDVFDFLGAVKINNKTQPIPFVFYSANKAQHERYATEIIRAAAKAMGARKYVLLNEFDSKKAWAEISEGLPDNVTRRDSLGGQVTTYRLSEISYSPTADRQRRVS